MNEPKNEEPALWAYVEVMGHQCVAGKVSEQRIAGFTMLKVEVPLEGRPPQLINPSSIFRMTPCTEDEARKLAPRSTVTITTWMLEAHQTQYSLTSAADAPVDVKLEEDPGF